MTLEDFLMVSDCCNSIFLFRESVFVRTSMMMYIQSSLHVIPKSLHCVMRMLLEQDISEGEHLGLIE